MSSDSTPLFDRLAARAAAHRAARALVDAELAEGRWADDPPAGVHLERATAHLGGGPTGVPACHPGDTVRVRVFVEGPVEGRAVVIGREHGGTYELLSPVDPWVALADMPREHDAWIVEVVLDSTLGAQRILVGICDGPPAGVTSWEDVETLLHPDAVTSVWVDVEEA